MHVNVLASSVTQELSGTDDYTPARGLLRCWWSAGQQGGTFAGDRSEMAITSRDVARLAGVSQPTVSRALRGDPRVAAETRARVESAVAALGYVPSEAGRNLVTRTAKRIGIVVSDLTNPFYPHLIGPLHDALEDHGYRMMVFTEPSDSQVSVEQLVDGSVDGVVLLTSDVGSASTRGAVSAPCAVRLPQSREWTRGRGCRGGGQRPRGPPCRETFHRAGASADRGHLRPADDQYWPRSRDGLPPGPRRCRNRTLPGVDPPRVRSNSTPGIGQCGSCSRCPRLRRPSSAAMTSLRSERSMRLRLRVSVCLTC